MAPVPGPTSPLFEPVRQALERGERVVLAGIGDSLTAGWMVREGFFPRFVRGVRARWPQAPVVAHEAGLPGDTAGGGARRLEPVLARAPHLLVIQFGINDAFVGVPVEAFSEHLRDMTRRARAAGAVPLVVTSCPLALPGEQGRLLPYYEVIEGLGAEPGVAVARLDRAWHRLTTGVEPLHQADGVHPTDAGHEVLARGLLEAF